jgi:hypothetical protein
LDPQCKDSSFARRTNRALAAAERAATERLFRQGLRNEKLTVISALDETIELPTQQV